MMQQLIEESIKYEYKDISYSYYIVIIQLPTVYSQEEWETYRFTDSLQEWSENKPDTEEIDIGEK